jgi:hypothetical protein
VNILWWLWERVVRGTVSVSLTLRGRDDTAVAIQGRDDTSVTIRGRDDTALTIRGTTNVAAYRDITIHQGERRSFTITDVDCTGVTVKGTVRDGSAGTQLAQSTATITDGVPTVVFTAAQTQTFPDGSDDGLDQEVHEYDISRTTSGQEAVLLHGRLIVKPSPTLGA